MIYECENCGKEFEVAEPICPKCHSGDVIEYNEKEEKNYLINLVGCDDTTLCEIKLTEDEINTFIRIAKEINKHSTYQCQPAISIFDKYQKEKSKISDNIYYDYEYENDLLDGRNWEE